MGAKVKKQAEVIFAVLVEDEESGEQTLKGYFTNVNLVEQYMERENIESCRILTVTEVDDATFPPEPMLEFQSRKLADVAAGRV